MRLLLRVAIVLAMMVMTTVARADGRRIVLVGADDAYTSAVFASLAAWDAQVVSVPSPPPATVTDDATWGRAIATRHAADAVSWIRASGSRGELVIFDVDGARVFRRDIDRTPPFDEPTAAAVALTIKSVLRLTRIAPIAERTERVEDAAPTAPTAPPERKTIGVWLEADGGLGRSFAGALEGRGALGLSVWPHDHLGVALRIAGGPGSTIETRELDGSLVDLSFGLGGRARVASGPIGLEVGAGASLHAMRAAGTLVNHAAEVSVPRANPALDASVALDWSTANDRVRIGLRSGLAYLLRAQRYLVGGIPTLDLDPVAVDGGLRIAVRVD